MGVSSSLKSGAYMIAPFGVWIATIRHCAVECVALIKSILYFLFLPLT